MTGIVINALYMLSLKRVTIKQGKLLMIPFTSVNQTQELTIKLKN